MSQTILERSQGEFNKIRNSEVGRGISIAKELDDNYNELLTNQLNNAYKVTWQAEPIDSVELMMKIKQDVESEIRPTSGQTSKKQDDIIYNILDLQQYVKNKGLQNKGLQIKKADYNKNIEKQDKEIEK